MNHKTSAQNENRCDVCETTIVHSYCDYCHVNLCKPCVVDHILDKYDDHKKPFKQRMSTLRNAKHINRKHANISTRIVTAFMFAPLMLLLNNTWGHSLEEVSKIYKTRNESIEKDTEKLENLINPQYNEILLDLENQLANLDGGYEKTYK